MMILLLLLPVFVFAWPDGAPCLQNNIKTMYPSALEHDGGFQDTESPYELEVDQKCYFPRTRIQIKLQGKDMSEREFKGFVIQARKVGTDEHMGHFTRDDNGSWRYQCFTNHAVITHSHNRKKTMMMMYWEYEIGDPGSANDNLQFIATIVENKHSFWVKDTRSIIIPPCRIERENDDNPMAVHYPDVKLPKVTKLEVHTNKIPLWWEGKQHGQSKAVNRQNVGRILSVHTNAVTRPATTKLKPTTTIRPTTTTLKPTTTTLKPTTTTFRTTRTTFKPIRSTFKPTQKVSKTSFTKSHHVFSNNRKPTTRTTTAKPKLSTCLDVAHNCAELSVLCVKFQYKTYMSRNCARTCDMC